MDFHSLASELLARSESLMSEWLPQGKRRGNEYVVGNLYGDPGDSLSINLNTGVWMDFATGETGGDLIALYAAMNRIEQGEAFRQLTNGRAPACLTEPPRHRLPPEPEIKLLVPAPDGVDPPTMRHPAYGHPSAFWAYRGPSGEVLGYVARYDPDGQRKQIIPWTYGEGRGWVMKQFPDPRPLYGLERVADAECVLVVEGEKAADAARRFMSSRYAVVTWPGGAQALEKVNWSPVYGKQALLWPDADKPGVEAMGKLARMLGRHCQEIRILDVSGMPDKWDAADSGFGWKEFLAWARPRAVRYEAPSDPEPEPEPDYEQEPEPETTWPDPVDLFSALAIPELRREWLPDVIADYAFDQAEIVGTDPALLALACIVSCAGAAHDGIKVQPGTHNLGWTESARLWGAIVGDPSIKKSPAVGRATSRLRKIDMELAEQEAKLRAQYAVELKVHDKREKQYADAIAKDEPADYPDPPPPPIIERLIVEDTTVEKLSEILAQCPRGILCIADELSGWFGAMDAYKQGSGGKDRANWLEIYNGGPRRVDRIGRGSYLVPNWSACMLGGIQPDAMRKVAANMPADGLLQRFMLVVGRPGKAGDDDRMPDLQAQDAYRATVDQIFSIKPTDDPIKLSAEAKKFHNEIVEFAYHMIALDCLPAGLMSHLGKWEGLAPRLMLTFHIIEHAAARKYPSDRISGATAERVRGFMIEFLFRHALVFYADILGDNGYADAVKWIGGYILAKGKDLLENRELTQNYGWWKSAKDWERSVVMQRLIDYSWVSSANPERDRFKALPTRLMVNPKVFEAFSEQAGREKARRDEVRRLMISFTSTQATKAYN